MRSATSNRSGRSTTGRGRTNVGMNSAGILRLVRPISIRSLNPAVVSSATRAPRRSRMAFVPTVVPWTSRRTRRLSIPSAASPARTAAASSSGCDGTLPTRTSPDAASTAVTSVKVPPTSTPTTNMPAGYHRSMHAAPIATRLAELDWTALERSLWDFGYAKTPPVLTPAECEALIALYGDDGRFRSRVDMARYRFGEGDYKYLAYPLPPLVETLRADAYSRLA